MKNDNKPTKSEDISNKIAGAKSTQKKDTLSSPPDYLSPNNKQSKNQNSYIRKLKHALSAAILKPIEFHKRHTEEPADHAHKETITEEISETFDALESLLNNHPQLRVILAIVAVGLLLAIGIGVVTYKPEPGAVSSHLQIAGISVDNLDESAALNKLKTISAKQQITIVIDGKSYIFSPKDLGMARDVSNLVEYSYSDPQSKIERLFIKRQKSSDIKTYVNKVKLIATIESQLGQQYKQAEDPSLSVNGESIIVQPGKAGIGVDFDNIEEQLEASKINSNITINVEITKTQPQIDIAAANAAKAQADDLISKTYAVKGNINGIRYASKAQKASWLKFNSDDNKKSINVAVDTYAAKNTLTQIAKSFTQGMREKVVLTFDGSPPTVIDSGQDGIGIDQDSLSVGLKQVAVAINNKQSYTIQLILVDQPAGERDLGGINGGKFILVDIASYRAYAVEDNAIARTMLVSTGIPSMPTPRGHFKILSKRPIANMTGCNTVVGCWNVPNVPSVQFFTGEGAAFHGTYWHHMFGIKNMSHGCVNLTLDDAAWLYGWTVVGTDVVIV